MSIDLNAIVNKEIENAYLRGRYDLAEEILKISSRGSGISEWMENQSKIDEKLFEIQDEYINRLRGMK